MTAQTPLTQQDGSLRLLLVEDDEGDARLVREALRGHRQRFALERARSVKEAADVLSRSVVDVVLLDLTVCDSTGMDTVVRMQAHVPEDTAIVVLTGLDDEYCASRVLEAGAQDYLVKGQVDAHTLPRSIRYAMERHRILRRLQQVVIEKETINAALRQSEARYRSVAASAVDALFVADESGRIVDWNDAAVRLLGGEALVSSSPTLGDLVTPECRDELAQVLERLPARGEASQGVRKVLELLVLRSDGTTATTEWGISSWEVAAGRFTSAMVRDVSERKAAERLLVEEADRLAGVVRAQHEIASEGFDLGRLLQAAVRWANTLAGAAGTAALMDTTTGLRCESACGSAVPEMGALARHGHGPAGTALARWQALEGENDQLAFTSVATAAHADRMCLTVPLTTDRGPAGVLLAVTSPGEEFNDRQRSALELVGGFCGTALTHLHEFEAKRRLLGERTAALAAVEDSEQRFRQAFDQAPAGIAMVSLVDGDRGALMRVNTTLCSMMMRTADELADMPLTSLAHADDRATVAVAIEDLANSGDGAIRKFDLRLASDDGTTRWAEATASTVTGTTGVRSYAIVQLADVTARRQAEHQLRRLALHDSLTGLANRALLVDRMQEALHRAERSGGAVGVLFVDLDHFKAVNDTMGHKAGDNLLVTVAERIASVLRASDMAARLGGDEFVVVYEGARSEEQVLQVAARIRGAIRQSCILDAGVVNVEASIGVCLSEPGDAPEALLARADTALYRAKERGRNRCEIMPGQQRGGGLSRAEIANGLRHAVEGGQLQLVYQPIYHLQSGRVTGAESLLRWRHPTLGLLSPGSFLQVAEETGAIVDVGRWVLHEACREAASWEGEDGCGAQPSVWVNLSGRQAAGLRVSDVVESALHSTGLRPDRLYLELTETVLFQASEETLEDFRYLVEHGVHLGIDDFGTGYASMSYLANLPVTFLKIDRSFIAGAPTRPQDAAIVDAVVGLGRTLGLTVVAEGIEMAEQLDWVGPAGCELAQGFYLGRPGPAAALPFSRESTSPRPERQSFGMGRPGA